MMKLLYLCLIGVLGSFIPNKAIAQPFWSEDFSEGMLPMSWSTQDISTNTQKGVWEFCNQPINCPPFTIDNSAFEPFQSPTADNGFVFMNSDGLGNLSKPHISQLVSEKIDCSQRESVYLRFQTFIATFEFNAAEHALVKIWDGERWTSFQPFPCLTANENKLSDNPSNIVLDISAVAANKSEVQIQWEWIGNLEYSWNIDDVELWENNPAVPPNACWFEDFTDQAEGWTLNPVTPQNTPWEWKLGGDVGQGFLAPACTFIQSPTSCSGAMVFNADYYTTGGDNDPIPQPYPNYVSELISPLIDLSEIDAPLSLEFNQLVRILNPAQTAPTNEEGTPLITSFAYSLDDGETWSTAKDVNPGLEPATSGNNVPPLHSRVSFPLPDLQGQAKVRIKFTFAGDFYYWAIDDIAIVKRPKYDLKINRNFFAIFPNAITPISQLEEVTFLADVTNIGAQLASNVQLNLKIEHTASASTIYDHTLQFGSIGVDSLIENHLFPQTFLPENIALTGSYEGVYEVSQDSLDADLSNNLISWAFEVSDTTFAKELGPTRNIAPSGNKSYSYGNCFYVPNGNNCYARYMSFSIANAQELEGKEISTILFKWDGDINEDRQANPNELSSIVGLNNYIFTGNESNELITIPVDVDEIGVPLEDDSYYLMVVRYIATDNKDCIFLASQEYDYLANWFVSDSIQKPRYASVVDVGNTGTYSLDGFGFDIVPLIRLHIGNEPDLSKPPIQGGKTVSTSTLEQTVNGFALWPNPVSNQLHFDFSNSTINRKISLSIFNALGKKVYTLFLDNQPSNTLQIDTNSWEAGTYWVYLDNGQQRLTKKFILQK